MRIRQERFGALCRSAAPQLLVLLLFILQWRGQAVPFCSSICPDGSAVPAEYLAVEVPLDGRTFTCGALQHAASFEEFTEEECKIGNALGVAACGCPDVRPPSTVCDLCEDGSLPELGRELSPDVSCLDMYLALYEEPDLENCKVIQATAGTYCGCGSTTDDDEEDFCRICGRGVALPDPLVDVTHIINQTTLEAITFNGTEYNESLTCGEAEFNANLGGTNGRECAYNRATYETACCAVPAVGEPNCTSICPPGYFIGKPDYGINTLGGISCALLEELVSAGNSTVDQCDAYQLLGMEYCSCSIPIPPAQPSNFTPCLICEDGTQPPNFDLQVGGNNTCLSLATEAYNSFDSSDMPQCKAFQAVFGQECGCDNTDAIVGSCPLCGDEMVLPDFSRTTENGTTTCGAVQWEANLVTELARVVDNSTSVAETRAILSNCSAYQSVYASDCCSSESPSMAPSSSEGIYPACNICGAEAYNTTYLNPDQQVVTPLGQLECGTIDQLGQAKFIPPEDCAWIQIVAPDPNNCHCVSTITEVPSASPTKLGAPTPAPTVGATLLAALPSPNPTPVPALDEQLPSASSRLNMVHINAIITIVATTIFLGMGGILI